MEPTISVSAGPTLDLWQHIFGDGHGWIGLFSGLRLPDSDSLEQPRSAYFEYPSMADEAEEWLTNQAGNGRETYYCAHVLTARRRVKANAAALSALYVDGDGAQVPPGIPHPTSVVASSPGRDQFYWRLTRPVPPEVGEQLNKRLAYAIGADRSGWDLTQLLRPPGMPNRKYADAPIVRLVSLEDRAHDPDELDRVLPRLAASTSTNGTRRARKAEAHPAGEGDRNAEPPVLLRDPADLAVWRGERVTPKKDSDGNPIAGTLDRSASLLNIGRVLYDAGATRPTIVTALAGRDTALGWRKYSGRSDAANQYAAIVDELERHGRTPRLELGRSNGPSREDTGERAAWAGNDGAHGEAGADRAAYPMQSALALLERRTAPEDEFLVGGLLPRARTTWIYSGPGVGKTLLMLGIGLHVAAGRPFCGREARQGTVLFFEEDGPIDVVAQYLDAVAEAQDIDLADLPLFINEEQGLRLTDADGLALAKTVVERHGPTLVVLDSCERILPSEKFSTAESDWLVKFVLWCVGRGITVVVIDHTKKQPGGKDGVPVNMLDLLYGGRTKSAIADFAIYLTGSFKRGGSVRAMWTKERWVPTEPLDLTFDDAEGFAIKRGPRQAATPSERKVLVWFNNGQTSGWFTREEIVTGSGISERSSHRVLREMVRRELLHRREEPNPRGGIALHQFALNTSPGSIFR